MASAISRSTPIVSTLLNFHASQHSPQIRAIPAPVLNHPLTPPSAKFSIPAWSKTAKDLFPSSPPISENFQNTYSSAILIGLGLLAVGLGLYEYLNSQGKRPDAPQHIAPLPLTDYLVVETNPR